MRQNQAQADATQKQVIQVDNTLCAGSPAQLRPQGGSTFNLTQIFVPAGVYQIRRLSPISAEQPDPCGAVELCMPCGLVGWRIQHALVRIEDPGARKPGFNFLQGVMGGQAKCGQLATGNAEQAILVPESMFTGFFRRIGFTGIEHGADAGEGALYVVQIEIQGGKRLLNRRH